MAAMMSTVSVGSLKSSSLAPISRANGENTTGSRACNFKAPKALKKATLSSSELFGSALDCKITSKKSIRKANVSVSAQITGKPTVLVAEKLGEAGLDLLRKFANVDTSYNLTPEELAAKISLVDALIVRSGTKVTREIFEAANGRLKVVGRAGVGIDNVDLTAATEVGCLVVNAPTANTVAAAEHGIALLCAMARNVAQADASIKRGVIFVATLLKSFSLVS